jgi:hypothetical protein
MFLPLLYLKLQTVTTYFCILRAEAGGPAPLPRRVDHYLPGVAELNVQLDSIEHLTKAGQSTPTASTSGTRLLQPILSGNVDLALEHLKAAVQLRPGNSLGSQTRTRHYGHPGFRA